jgi:hypothetical protein
MESAFPMWRPRANQILLKGVLVGASAFALGGCKGLQAVDAFTSNQRTSALDPEDANALTSSVDAYDYGLTFSEDAAKSAVIVLKNSSKKVLYLKAVAGSQSANFSVIKHDCPLSPATLLADDTCSLTVAFKPREAGNLSFKATASYGMAPGEEGFSRSIDFVGVGVKPLVFGGLDAVNPATVTTTKARLVWSAVEGAASYALYEMGASPQLLSLVPADQTSYQVTGLTPATSYAFRVKAVNALGYEDTNKVDRSLVTDALGAFGAVPTLALAEGNVGATANLANFCTDAEGSVPTNVVILSQSDANLNCQMLTAPFRLQCSPGYKTGQTAWSGTASLSCLLNEAPSAYLQNVTVSVANTNRAPTLTGLPDQSVTAGTSLATLHPAASDADGDALTYLCHYDNLADGLVASTAANCSALINYDGSAASFAAATGVFAWTPPLAAANKIYEFEVQASDPQGLKATARFTVTVSPAPASTSLSTVAASATSVASGSSVTVTLTARDLSGQSLPYGGASVVFSNSGGTSTGTWSAVTDHGDGTYSATFTGLGAGTPTSLRATINGSLVTSSVSTVAVTPGAASATQSRVTVAASSVSAGASVTVTLTTKDAAGNRLTTGGGAVSFSRSGGTSTGTFGTVSDNGDGTYSAAFMGAFYFY